MGRFFPGFIAAFLLVTAVPAQKAAAQEAVAYQAVAHEAGGIFPLALILEAQEAVDAGAWRPDWPPEIPPDAFRVRAGDAAGISLEMEDYPLGFSFGTDGRVVEFPFMLNGRMAQAVRREGMVLTFPSGGERWEFEFLEYADSWPSLVRASLGGAVYFIYLSRTASDLLESWHDAEGRLVRAYNITLTQTGYSRPVSVPGHAAALPVIGREARIKSVRDYADTDAALEYHYDSRGFLSGSSGPAGDFRVHFFREDLPRYWERSPAGGGAAGNISFQWDAGGLLAAASNEQEGLERRYEYTFDSRGNWIERREIIMTRQMGLLVPSVGAAVRRILTYRNSE